MNPKHLKLVAEIWSIQRTFLVSFSKHLSKHSKKSAHPPWGSKKESPQNPRSLGLSSSQRCRQLAPVERVHRLCDLHHVLWRWTSDVADHHPLDAENEQNITEIIRIMLGLSEYAGEKKTSSALSWIVRIEIYRQWPFSGYDCSFLDRPDWEVVQHPASRLCTRKHFREISRMQVVNLRRNHFRGAFSVIRGTYTRRWFRSTTFAQLSRISWETT